MPASAPATAPGARPRRRPAVVACVVLVAVVAALVAAGLAVLWPAQRVPGSVADVTSPGVSTVPGEVVEAQPLDCGDETVDADGNPVPTGPCGDLTVRLRGGVEVDVTVVPAVYRAGVAPGDDLELLRVPAGDGPPTYQFVDFRRGAPLGLLAAVLALLVVGVARWRGLAAMAGAALSLLVVIRFVLPALLAGESALGVAVVGSSVIVLVVLYLAHGVSVRTTTALLGTLVGLAVTALLGVWATGAAHLTGAVTEDETALAALASQVRLAGVVAASMVVAGLGVLNDVTVTQASAVWELRASRPDVGRAHLFASAMRIGRDHIASSIYTLVFAYAGSALTVLLLISVYQRPLLEVATTDQVGTEVVRTLVGAIGLVLAVPVTTALAVLLAPGPGDERPPAAAAAGGPVLAR